MSDQVHRYPDMRADNLVRQIACSYNVSQNEVVFGNGSAALLQLLIDTTCVPNSDDEVLFFTPEFVLYRHLANMRRLKVAAVGATRSTQFDVRQLIAAANQNTRICLVSNPHNPTGIYFNRENILTLIHELPQHVLLVIDEAYAEFATARDFPNTISLRHLRENLVVVRTFSKAYGLAGLRIGYLIGNADIASTLRQQTLPYQINSLAEVAAIAAINDKSHLDRSVATNAQERQYMQTKLAELGVHVWESQGNFLFVEMGHNTEMFYRSLAERGIDVSYISEVPGLRITVNTRQQNQVFLETLTDLLKRLPTGTLKTDSSICRLIDVGKLIEHCEYSRAQQMLKQIQQIPGIETKINGRLALAFAQGLNLRISQQEIQWDNLYCKHDMIGAFRVLLKQTPLIRQGHLVSLVAIAEALSMAKKIHIVDNSKIRYAY
jgi:histidinol-phosphate aminotransferase